MIGKAQLQSGAAHLILEQIAQRFAELQIHAFRQSPHVVVAFDDRGAAGTALNYIGVDGTLYQIGDLAQFAGLLLKHPDEFLTDDFALLLRIGYPGQLI